MCFSILVFISKPRSAFHELDAFYALIEGDGMSGWCFEKVHWMQLVERGSCSELSASVLGMDFSLLGFVVGFFVTYPYIEFELFVRIS